MRFKSKHPYCILFLSLFLLGSNNLQEIVLVKTSAQTAAFVNVSVIPMDRERVLKDQTVVIQDGKIVEIGQVKKVAVPEDALRIEGRGLFLIPGLADLHVHMHSLSDVLLWLVHGVTTVRNMRGTPLHLTWRQLIAEGKMLGPTLFTCGPILDGSPASGESVDVIETKEEAEQNVANQKAAGYDCVKVYNRLSPLAYGAITDAAKRYGLPVTGHVPSKVGLGGVLAAQQESIEHLTGFMTALKKDGNMINQSAISKVAKETNVAGVWNCPTLIVEEKLSESDRFRKLRYAPELRLVPPNRIAFWQPDRNPRIQAMTGEDFEGARRGVNVLKILTKALYDAGAGVVVGTDAPSYLVVPGFSVHEELANFVEAGLTPYQALSAATRDAAEFLKQTEFGKIEKGKRADLVLLKENPLKDISATRRIAGVMVRGRWIPEQQIQETIESVVGSYRVPEDRFQSFPPLRPELPVQTTYEAIFNGVVVGEERIALRNGDGEATEFHAQQISDPPLQSSYVMHWKKERSGSNLILESERPEGSGRIEIRITPTAMQLFGSLPFQPELKPVEMAISGEMLLQTSMMSSRFLIAKKLRELQIGETSQFSVKELDFGVFLNKPVDFQESAWSARREQDRSITISGRRQSVRRFTIEIKRAYQTATAVFEMDEDGVPVLFYKGSRGFRRKDLNR